MWTSSFLRPRDTKVTSRFGSGRVFNGRVSSSHLGVDYRGSTGEPIFAANRGVVALVAEFFLAGNVVYVNHGDGLVTGYFHMSQPEVAVGDTVERGQEIGLVGSTGRVTGPHLHWSARFGALTIDPGDLLALGASLRGARHDRRPKSDVGRACRRSAPLVQPYPQFCNRAPFPARAAAVDPTPLTRQSAGSSRHVLLCRVMTEARH